MVFDSTRRKFLKAGVVLPAAGLLSAHSLNVFSDTTKQAQDNFMSLPDGIRSVRCSDCSTCSIQCPNGVDVQNRLIRAQELLA